MSVTVTCSGTDIIEAKDKFIKSTNVAINNLQSHQFELNQIFRNNITQNATRAGIDIDFFDSFQLKVKNNHINFINMEPLTTQRYEYGYDTQEDDDESIDDVFIETGPRYFIRPAINDTLQYIGYILLNDAKKSYNNIQINERDNYQTQE